MLIVLSFLLLQDVLYMFFSSCAYVSVCILYVYFNLRKVNVFSTYACVYMCVCVTMGISIFFLRFTTFLRIVNHETFRIFRLFRMISRNVSHRVSLCLTSVIAQSTSPRVRWETLWILCTSRIFSRSVNRMHVPLQLHVSRKTASANRTIMRASTHVDFLEYEFSCSRRVKLYGVGINICLFIILG